MRRIGIIQTYWDDIKALGMIQVMRLLGLRLRLRLMLEIEICNDLKVCYTSLENCSLINRMIKPLIV